MMRVEFLVYYSKLPTSKNTSESEIYELIFGQKQKSIACIEQPGKWR